MPTTKWLPVEATWGDCAFREIMVAFDIHTRSVALCAWLLVSGVHAHWGTAWPIHNPLPWAAYRHHQHPTPHRPNWDIHRVLRP